MPDLESRFKQIKLFIIDIDGVLTDGRIVYGVNGDELRFFDVRDGFGIVLLKHAGIPTVIITSKRSRIVKKRARDLKVDVVYQGFADKVIPFEKALCRFRVKPEEACFIGDDLVDIPVLRRVGLAVAVPNAVDEVKDVAHYVTSRMGGRGAVREISDRILKSRGLWEKVTAKYSA